MNDKGRDLIAGAMTKKKDDEDVSPFAQLMQEPQAQYTLPPVPGRDGVLQPSGNLPQLGGLGLDAYGQGGSIDQMRRLQQPGYGVRMRYGTSF